jgi:hypothetical protein
MEYFLDTPRPSRKERHMTEFSSPSAIQKFFLDTVPEKVLFDSARAIIGGYQEAFRYCRETFSPEEALDLYPHHRRAVVERNWRAGLQRHQLARTETARNAKDNCSHTEMIVGKTITTISAVSSPNEVVREALFRTGLAHSSQAELFEVEEPPLDGFLYAIILHGPTAAGFLSAPAFIHVAFPDRECNRYVERFSLLRKFPALQSEIDKVPSVPVQRNLPRVRRERTQRAE